MCGQVELCASKPKVDSDALLTPSQLGVGHANPLTASLDVVSNKCVIEDAGVFSNDDDDEGEALDDAGGDAGVADVGDVFSLFSLLTRETLRETGARF